MSIIAHMTSLVQVHLKKGEDRRVKFGHPWIFSNQVTSLVKAEPGSLAVFKDADQRTVGHGTINPHSLIYGRILTRRTTEEAFSERDLRDILQRAAAERAVFMQNRWSHRVIFG